MAGPTARRGGRSPVSALERGLVATLAAAIPAYLAVEGGGYDLIVRHGAGIVVWWSIALGLVFGLLPRARPAAESRLAALVLAALAAWTAIGLIGTESDGRTFDELARVLTYAGLFTLAWTTLAPGSWRAAAAGLSIAALAVPALAVASRLAPAAFESVAVAELLETERLAYPLGYWNAVAAWCAMAFSIGLAWSAHSRRDTTRALALGALPVVGLALYLTYSRAGIAALLLGVGAVVAASHNRTTATVNAGIALAATAIVVLLVRGQPEIADGTGSEGAGLVALFLVAAAGACAQAARLTRRARLERWRISVPSGPRAIGAAVGLAFLVAVAIGPSIAERAGGELGAVDQPQFQEDPAARLASLEGTRMETWASALRAFGSAPLTGTGAGAFQLWWDRDAAEAESIRDAHSLYLEALAELGLPGLAILVAFLGAVLLGALRAWGAVERPSAVAATCGFLAAYIAFLFHAGVDWLWEFPALVALGIGGAVVVASARASRLPSPAPLTRQRLALAVLAVLAGAAHIPALVSMDRARAAEEALAVGLHNRADQLAHEAVRAQPWAAEPYALRALVALSDDRPTAARADAHEAAKREPTNWRHQLLIARIEIEAGRRSAARQALDEAAELRPAAVDEVDRLRRQLQGQGG